MVSSAGQGDQPWFQVSTKEKAWWEAKRDSGWMVDTTGHLAKVGGYLPSPCIFKRQKVFYEGIPSAIGVSDDSVGKTLHEL